MTLRWIQVYGSPPNSVQIRKDTTRTFPGAPGSVVSCSGEPSESVSITVGSQGGTDPGEHVVAGRGSRRTRTRPREVPITLTPEGLGWSRTEVPGGCVWPLLKKWTGGDYRHGGRGARDPRLRGGSGTSERKPAPLIGPIAYPWAWAGSSRRRAHAKRDDSGDEICRV